MEFWEIVAIAGVVIFIAVLILKFSKYDGDDPKNCEFK
jgi:hypothetical protein